MGMYADHGVEYHVLLKNGEYIVIVKSKDADDRLIKSSFFQNQKDWWMSADAMYGKGSYMKPLGGRKDFDVELTDDERARLERVLMEKADDVCSHGWYEVNTITCSYDFY